MSYYLSLCLPPLLLLVSDGKAGSRFLVSFHFIFFWFLTLESCIYNFPLNNSKQDSAATDWLLLLLSTVPGGILFTSSENLQKIFKMLNIFSAKYGCQSQSVKSLALLWEELHLNTSCPYLIHVLTCHMLSDFHLMKKDPGVV